MFPNVTDIEFNAPKKVNNKLSICNPTQSHYIQLGKLDDACLLKWGASVPYGKTPEDTDHFIIDIDIGQEQGHFFTDLDAKALESARNHTNNKRMDIKKTVQFREDGSMFVRTKLYLSDSPPIYDELDNKSGLDNIKSNTLAVMMVKLTSLWIAGSECGIGLRVKKIKKVGQVEPVIDVVPDFI